ncbi:MAG: Xaa-Pro dipeptidase [Gammaproteobacteria bacterium]|jgi:Xaa-Pro dipeptidase
MALWFDHREFEERQLKLRAQMAAQNLDGMLLFKQESMYYLTGYDTDGFVLFQTLFMGVNGEVTLVTRSADHYQAEVTSTIKDIRIWVDSGDQNPALDVADMLRGHAMQGKRIGVEYDAYGLSAKRGKDLDATLIDAFQLIDASNLVREIRLVKSTKELEYIRTAGEICDEARDIALKMSVPGAREGDIRAEMHNAIWRRDGDTPAHVWPMGAGVKAPLVRYHSGSSTIGNNDVMFHEFAAPFRHYHAATTLAVAIGKVDPELQQMFDTCKHALEAVENTLTTGNTVGDLFEAHSKAYIEAGHGNHYLNVCGYSMGAVFPPTWMEDPLIRKGDTQVLQPGMVFFMHMLMVNREQRMMMSLGEQAIVTDGRCELVTHAPRELPRN